MLPRNAGERSGIFGTPNEGNLIPSHKTTTTICLKDYGNIVVNDQMEVAEMLATYFTNAALNIGGDNIVNRTEEDNNNHTSVMMIRERESF